jgi:hypothetical protein
MPSGPSGSIAHMEEEFRDLERMSRPRWPLALAVVLLVGAATGAYFWLGRTPQQGSVARPLAMQGVPIDIAEPRNGSVLEAAPAVFAWESIAGRNDYLFRLEREGAATPLLERSSKTPKLELSEVDAGRLVPGRYVWTVRARAKDGSVLGTGRGRFQLR